MDGHVSMLAANGDLVDNKNLTYHYLGDFDADMLKVIKSVKNIQQTPVTRNMDTTMATKC